jgi:hypothetical protein
MAFGQELALPVTLSTFGRLIKTIVPRTDCAALFDRQGHAQWVSGSAVPDDLHLLVGDLLASADEGGSSYALRCALNAAASYAFTMRNPVGELTGALALSIDGPFRSDELLLPRVLEQRLGPLLAAGARAIADPVERALAQLAALVRCDAAVVCVPRQEFFHCHSAAGSRLQKIATLRQIATGELAWRAESVGDTLCVNKARINPQEDPFRFISVPLRRRATVFGVLVVFTHVSRPGYEAADRRAVAEGTVRLAKLLDPEGAGAIYFNSRRLINRTDSATPQVA